MESTSPALSVSIAVLTALLGLTGFGIYTAFGPPSAVGESQDEDEDEGSEPAAQAAQPRPVVARRLEL